MSNTSSFEARRLAAVFVFLSGGISLLTLVVNGTTAGKYWTYWMPYARIRIRYPTLPKRYTISVSGFVLKALRLGKCSNLKGRTRALKLFKANAEEYILEEFKKLIVQPRFRNIEFSIVEAHSPFLKTYDELKEEINRYELPRALTTSQATSVSLTRLILISCRENYEGSQDAVVEMRQLFLELLSEAYEKLLAKGELDNKEHRGFNADVLKQSVAFALGASNEEALNDWEYTNML